MKIKLKIEAYGFKPGSVIEVSQTRADELLEAGDAERVESKSKAKKAGRLIDRNKSLSAAE